MVQVFEYSNIYKESGLIKGEGGGGGKVRMFSLTLCRWEKIKRGNPIVSCRSQRTISRISRKGSGIRLQNLAVASVRDRLSPAANKSNLPIEHNKQPGRSGLPIIARCSTLHHRGVRQCQLILVADWN
ncbi:hypothetical protein J6590_038907 [Homalodisca vitripennis]|nr:hypothetical protein J6590_038907 [Homalodisca vitripennis]